MILKYKIYKPYQTGLNNQVNCEQQKQNKSDFFIVDNNKLQKFYLFFYLAFQTKTKTNQMQQQVQNNHNKNQPKSVEDKGMLLARLLEKAVQNKINKKTSPSLLKTQSYQNHNNNQQTIISKNFKQDDNLIIKNHHIIDKTNQSFDNQQSSQNLLTEVNQQLKATKQSINKKSTVNSSILKSKITSYEEHNFSFDDSMSIQPSYLTIDGQQISQMLKYIYIQLFGEQKYQADRKRYQQIQANPDQYNMNDGHEFNKEGKMLENICFQIRTFKYTIKKLTKQAEDLQKQNIQFLNIINKNKYQLKSQQQYSKSQKQIPKQQILQKNTTSLQLLQQQNIALTLAMKQLQQQNLRLEQALNRLQKQHQNLITTTDSQNIKNRKKFQKIIQLQEIIQMRDRQIDNLLMNIGELQIELGKIKEEIQRNQRQGYFQKNNSCTPKKKNNMESKQQESSIQRLSTIKQEEQPINITDFIQLNENNLKQKLQKQVQTQNQPITQLINTPEPSELSLIILELKKILTHKEKTLLQYQKQIQCHQSQIQKYQGFIAQLSSQIQTCQQKLLQTNKKSAQMTNRKVQTDEKYFILLRDNYQNSYNRDLTSGQRQDGFLSSDYQYQNQKQPSIADQVDKNDNLMTFSNQQEITFKKIINNTHNIPQINNINKENKQIHDKEILKQKLWDQMSVTLSQFSQTQQLRDIRNLTKQLSQAYDKIISLTYQVNSLKKLSSMPNSIQQPNRKNQFNINQQNIKMIKQK